MRHLIHCVLVELLFISTMHSTVFVGTSFLVLLQMARNSATAKESGKNELETQRSSTGLFLRSRSMMALKIVLRQKEDCAEKHDLVCLNDTIKNRHSVLA